MSFSLESGLWRLAAARRAGRPSAVAAGLLGELDVAFASKEE